MISNKSEITKIVHSSHRQKYNDSLQSQTFTQNTRKIKITPEDDDTDCTAESNEENGIAQKVNNGSLV